MVKYDSYKDSGVEWIGKIPFHWNSGDMKYQLTNNDGGVWGSDCENEEEGTVVIRSTEITIDGKWDLSNPTKRKLNDNEINKCKLYKDDIVLTKSSGSPNHIGKSVIVDEIVENLNCCYSNFVQRIRFKNYNSKLYHYILNSYVVREQYRYVTQSTTGLGNLNRTTLDEIQLPFIPLQEQQQIVSFLDTKTSLIDSLIEKTQRKIELLKEKRTSLINEVVTKGLNPNVEMKNSGVKWIGEIPKKWYSPQIKYVTELMRGKFSHRPRNDQKFYNGEYPFIQTGDIVSSGKHLTSYTQTLNERGYSVSKEFPIDTLVMTISGNIGDVSILKIRSCFPDSIIGFFPYSITSVDFLYYVFTSLKQEFYKNSTVSTQMNLNVERVGSIKIPLPSNLEQQQIVEYLDEQTNIIDTTITKEQKRTKLLKEYRQSLISEVVTGKIKVLFN
jgi:type I restriction enzyme S subunit